MPERLSPLDASFLYLEDTETPMHVGSVAVFRAPSGGFDYERLIGLVRDRIAFVPRYRQRVRGVPGRLANPVWVDDPGFDLTDHVLRSALPRPGSDQQLEDLVAQVMSRRLDRSRPLWEMYLVEGLSDDRFAVIGKTHQSMVDGIAALDIGQVVLDESADVPAPESSDPDPWRARPGPGPVELVVDAVTEALSRPGTIVENLRSGVADVGHSASRAADAAWRVAGAVRVAARTAPSNPLNAPIGSQRRYAMLEVPLEQFREVRAALGGTVNDVVLAVVCGALRAWMLTRGASVRSSTTVRAMVPVSVRTVNDDAGGGDSVAGYLVDLPVGEPSPVLRLQRISYAMSTHEDVGQAVSARALVGLAGFAPPTLHALGARVASGLSRRVFNLVVTNVPGPQVPLYAGGARMLASYPVVPLARGQGLAIGVTSYEGEVFFGLNGDRDAMPDLDVLRTCLRDALDELTETVAAGRRRRPPRTR